MRLPSARTPPDPDDARIGALAAGLTLGGHALVLLAALLLSGREVATVAIQNAVSVTLVGGGAQGSGGAADAAAPAQTPPPAAPTPAPAPALTKTDAEASGERLDQLLAPTDKPVATTPAAQSVVKGGTARPSSSAAAANPAGAAGSSRAGQVLGPGEGAEGVDLYAGASLPDVGRRSAEPSGDLWRQVSACWRPAAPRRATLLVELSPDGRLTASPQAIRGQGATIDPQTLLAERAALRALQACAPYPGLGGKRWRVEFP